MYFIIFSLPLVILFAAAQFLLLKKTEKRAIRFIPLYLSIFSAAVFGIMIIDDVNAFIGNYIGWGVFALIVYLAIGTIGSVIGTAVGWIIYKITRKSA